ncbi:MAG: retropepsin-like aspartic protease, partial [Candidatus Thiodiazotropha sp.]
MHKEADASTKYATKRLKINLTGNSNSCLIKIQKQKVRSLLDTGSETCLISYKFYKSLKNKPPLKKCVAHLESVEGGALKTLGKVTLNFQIKGLDLTYDFFVVDGINRSVILGENWMTDMGVRMYFDLGLIRIKGIYVPIVSDKHISSIVRTAKAITLRPNTSYVLSAKVKKNETFIAGKECVISSLDDK